MKRANWLDRLENWLLVSVITVLTWLYAEGKNVARLEVTLTVRFVAPADQRVLIEQQVDQVRVTVEASNDQYERLRDIDTPIELELPADLLAGQTMMDVPVETRLAGSAALRGLGKVLEVQPETLPVRVERIVTVPMRVEADRAGASVSAIAVKPERVNVSLRQGLATLAETLRLTASLADVPNLAELTPNVQYTRELPLQLPTLLREPTVRPEVSQVELTFTLSKQNDEMVLSRVPIHLRALWEDLNQFDIIVDGDNLVLPQDVTVSGPPEAIARIRSGEFTVVAELRLKSDEFLAGTASKPAVLTLPQGVTLVGPPPVIRYTMVPR